MYLNRFYIKTKVTYIISNIDKAIGFEWIVEKITVDKFQLQFILLNPSTSLIEDFLKQKNIPVYRINYTGKKSIPLTIFKILWYLLINKTNIVHCHLFDATFCGLIAAKLAGVKKRIYTRHYSTYHLQYFPKTVKWDKLNNYLATDVVAISNVVKQTLITKENLSEKKITLIHHGFDVSAFSEIDKNIIQNLKTKYNSETKFPVIGVISRFTHLKGVQFIIPAFKKLLHCHPNALLLLFNASGDYEKNIDELLLDLPLNSYQKVAFENEITSLYHLFDIFVHVPINENIEAFGQTYIESMASGTSLIATKSGIANEFLTNQNSVIVPYQNSESIFEGFNALLNNKDLKKTLIKNALIDVKNKFELSLMINKLEQLYLR